MRRHVYSPRIAGPYARARSGLSIIEMLAASLIIAVSLIGLVSTWIQMVQASITTDDRSAAYQCARMLVERAHSVGFVFDSSSDFATVQAMTQENDPSAFSPAIQAHRYFDHDLTEIYASSADDPPTDTLSRAHYYARTVITYTGDVDSGGNALVPSGRNDLKLEVITVSVYSVQHGGPNTHDSSSLLCSLQTCLAQGGT